MNGLISCSFACHDDAVFGKTLMSPELADAARTISSLYLQCLPIYFGVHIKCVTLSSIVPRVCDTHLIKTTVGLPFILHWYLIYLFGSALKERRGVGNL
uniref:Uncharacterized protein n=1 Tax=Mesocestoides corti TaxID=53468 RepID=A0A5K3EKH7_MESCO